MLPFLLWLWLAPARASEAPAAAPSFKKVMIVVFENTDYPKALGQPFFAKLAREGALLAAFYAETHPSQPNYIAMVAGDTLGVASDSRVDLGEFSLADLLEAKGRTWKVYAEDYPGGCYLKMRSRKFARKHVPFLSFKGVTTDPERCARIVNAKFLARDLEKGTLPDFSLYIPNLNDDGHDTAPAFADAWYKQTFAPLLADPRFTKDLLLVTTFDEDDNEGGNNQIYTSLWGSMVKPGYVSAARCDHYSVLRTIEDAWSLGTLRRNDAKASPIAGVWRETSASPR